jgi:hypothetical protein
MTKLFNEIAFEKFNTRSSKDNRRKVNMICVSYLDTNGDEYRKAYEFSRDTKYDSMLNAIPRSIA